MNKTFFYKFMIAGAALTLCACEATKEQFDFTKKPPDEFAITKHAPLEMPPDYSIRAPRPGAQRPQELATDQQARDAILGPDARRALAKREGVSEGEAVLLQKTGGASASAAIRSQVDQETAELIEDETPGIDTLKKMVGKKTQEPSFEEVDPVAEVNRIKANKAQGKPLSTGKTPKKED